MEDYPICPRFFESQEIFDSLENLFKKALITSDISFNLAILSASQLQSITLFKDILARAAKMDDLKGMQ